MTTYWITKYALTMGIKTLTDAEVKVSDDGYLSDKSGSCMNDEWKDRSHFYGRNDWHASHTQAMARANQMREAKIASLKKQITKLDKMKF